MGNAVDTALHNIASFVCLGYQGTTRSQRWPRMRFGSKITQAFLPYANRLAFTYRPLVSDMYVFSLHSIIFRCNLVTDSLMMFLNPSLRSVPVCPGLSHNVIEDTLEKKHFQCR